MGEEATRIKIGDEVGLMIDSPHTVSVRLK
jgi:hypothetical protein